MLSIDEKLLELQSINEILNEMFLTYLPSEIIPWLKRDFKEPKGR